jgi:hypothetical protein
LATVIEGAELSFKPQPFYIEEVDMFERLSFDWFVSKIHQVFDGLPDPRKFSPNLRYSSLLKDASIPGRSPRTMKDAA